MRPLYRQRTKGEVASRGWMFLGEQGGPCDKKCEMCYYAWQTDLVFYSLPTLIGHANLFRHYYGLTACDITGGEPTIMKGIGELVEHCSRIGLRPTLITHGQNLNDHFWEKVHGTTLARFEEHLDDWLVSLHGDSPKSHDAVLCQEGSYERLVANLDGLRRPARFNTTLLTDNVDDLPVRTLLERPPTVWNLINFNPFHAWSQKKDIDFQVKLEVSAPKVAAAVHKLEAAGWEVNVRYWPLCVAEQYGFARNVSGYHQVPFDPWEWRLGVTNRRPLESIEKAGGWYQSEREQALSMMASRDNSVCSPCAWAQVCDKPTDQYQSRFGLDELKPVEGTPVTDPLFKQFEEAQ